MFIVIHSTSVDPLAEIAATGDTRLLAINNFVKAFGTEGGTDAQMPWAEEIGEALEAFNVYSDMEDRWNIVEVPQ